MAGLRKIFSTSLLVLTLALIASATNHIAKFDTLQDEKSNDISANSADYRLPKLIIPHSYDLKITNIDFDSFIFNGTVTISAQVKESTKEIVLNAGSITVGVISVTENGQKVELIETKHNQVIERFKIILEKKLAAASTINISLSFNGTLRDDTGFYKSSYFNDKGKQRWLAATLFYPSSARHVFPCFDEPEFKAEFEIGLHVPEGYSCLSNMKYKLDETKKWCHFDKSVKMSTYLVAFVVSDFLPDPNNDSSLKLWARPNANTQTTYGQTIGAKALKALSKLFGQDYYEIMKKMDIVALPDFSLGDMENWGLITYREDVGLYDENQSSDDNQQSIASGIVHECTHMWLGNLVTIEWWNYLWLSEGFASYYEYIGTDMMDQQFIVELFQTAMAADSDRYSPAMTRQPEETITPTQILGLIDSITYNKGACIVRMMEKTFGTDGFYNALRNYIQARKFNIATPSDLWQAFQKFVDSKLDVKTIMKTWTEQAGYPYVTVNVESDRIKLRQDQFLLRENNSVSVNTTWWVPITLSSSSSPSNSTKPAFWLSEREVEIKRVNQNDDWLILNVESAGFYRVNYDRDSWERIIQLLTNGDFSKIHAVNRASIVDDLLNFARAKLVDYKLVFKALQYLKKETHYLPITSALTGLDYFTRLMAEGPGYDILKNHTLSLIKNVYDKVTFDDKPGDDRLTILLRQALNSRACVLDEASCVSKSQNYFNDWKMNKEFVPKNQKSVVYCTAIKHGTADDWEFLYNQYQKTEIATEKTTILYELGCSQDTKILEKYMRDALSSFESSRIREQDIGLVLNGIYTGSVKNAEFMIDFADKNHQVFYDHDGNYDQIASVILGVLGEYPLKRLVNKVEKIVEANATHIAPNADAIKNGLDFAKQEIDFFNKNLLPVLDSLK